MKIYQSNTYRKDLSWLHFDNELRVIESEGPTVLHIRFCGLSNNSKQQLGGTCPEVTTVVQAWVYGRFIEIPSNLRRKKLRRTNQGFNFLGGSFSNRNTVSALIQFRRESQPQHLKRSFFLKNRPICFQINSTNVIRPVKSNQLSFSSIAIKKATSCPGPQCLIDQIQVQKPILFVATDQMLDHIQNREQYHRHREQYHR